MGCENAEPVILETSGFLQMQNSSASIIENVTDPITATVVLGGTASSSDITVNYTVSSSDDSRYTISPSTGTVTIPAGEFTADIQLFTVDNFDVDGDVDVIIELDSTNSLPVGIAGEGLKSNSQTITVVDNDCPIEINDWVGVYTVFENFIEGNNSPLGLVDFFGESYQIEISLLQDDLTGTKVVINNSAGFNQYMADGTILSFDTCNKKFSLDAGDPEVALFSTVVIETTSYDESKFVIHAEGPLGNFGQYQFTFTKQ